MANRERGEATLVTRQQAYTLRLTVEACVALEHQTGQAWDDLIVAVQRGRTTALRALLWAALQPKHADVMTTLDQVGAIIDAAGGARAVRAVLHDFLALNLPLETPGKKRKPTPPDDRPGSLWQRLYVDAREFGMSGEAFWALSLKELWLEQAAWTQQRKTMHDAILTQSWWTACLVWQSKLPSLKKLLGGGKVEPQSPEEARAMMEQLSGALGVPLIQIQLQPPKGSTHGK